MATNETCPKCGACDRVVIHSTKHGAAYWRPNAFGYTTVASHAGRYWRCAAQEIATGHDHLSLIPESDAKDIITNDAERLAAANAANAKLTAHVQELEGVVERLKDDALAEQVAKDCHDTHHDERWCPTCAARGDGIDAYREALAAESRAQ